MRLRSPSPDPAGPPRGRPREAAAVAPPAGHAAHLARAPQRLTANRPPAGIQLMVILARRTTSAQVGTSWAT